MNPRYPFGVYTISNRARSTGLRDFSIAVKLKTIQFSLSTIANARGKVKSDFAAREDFFGFFQLSSRSPFCRMVMRMGVPSSPNVERIWFSIYR